jgi:hypothetical protein
MVDVMRLYLDDSGTRHPDRVLRSAAHGHDWFGLGGVLVRENDVEALKLRHESLRAKWQLKGPLHSSEIRGCHGNFRWLRQCEAAPKEQFFADIQALVTGDELTAIACVIDRPGYNQRYRSKYGRAPWLLCKTAFTVVVERSAKFARRHGCVLRVYVERSDRHTDRRMRGYYDEMRARGHPFDASSASKYHPLSPPELSETLYEFRTQDKTSELMQVADLVLWPMCVGGYDAANRPYTALKQAGTLIDSRLDAAEVADGGIKYSCWELQHRKDRNPILGSGSGQPPLGDLVG